MEVPSEADNSSFCQNVKLTAYPLVKIGDVLWTYMGDPAEQPPLPEFEFVHVPAEQTYTSKRWQECNWLQAFEGGIDSSHVTFLHSGGLKTDPLFKGAKGNEYNLKRHASRSSRWRTATAACSSAPAATPRRAPTTGGSRRG